MNTESPITQRVEVSIDLIKELLDYSNKMKELINVCLDEKDIDIDNLPYIFMDMMDNASTVEVQLLQLLRIQNAILNKSNSTQPIKVDLTNLN